MAGTFDDAIAGLLHDTPDHITGQVEMDQVYAHYQHEHPEFKHPRGGQAFFLRDALYDSLAASMARLAEAVNRADLTGTMAQVTESISRAAYALSPVEFDALRRSGHPTVVADGVVTYDRAPEVPRLSEEQLKARGHR